MPLGWTNRRLHRWGNFVQGMRTDRVRRREAPTLWFDPLEQRQKTGQLMTSTITKRRRNSATTAAVAMTALLAGLTVAETAFPQQVGTQRTRRAVAGPVINRVAFEGNRSVER